MLEDFDTVPYLDIKSKVTIDRPTPKTMKSKRIFILGPAKSGKDTLAVAISKYVWFGGTVANYKGSTSLAMLPYVHKIACIFDPLLQSMPLPRYYDLRTINRMFWYHVIKAYRELDPFFIINEEDSDIFVGSRDWGEIKSCVDCTTNPYFVVCRSYGGDGDPTWPYSYEDTRLRLMRDFNVDTQDIVTFDYKSSNFELFLSIQKTAEELGRVQNLRVSYLAREYNFERHGVRYDDVLKGRF